MPRGGINVSRRALLRNVRSRVFCVAGRHQIFKAGAVSQRPLEG